MILQYGKMLVLLQDANDCYARCLDLKFYESVLTDPDPIYASVIYLRLAWPSDPQCWHLHFVDLLVLQVLLPCLL